jgi:hypothetical protein
MRRVGLLRLSYALCTLYTLFEVYNGRSLGKVVAWENTCHVDMSGNKIYIV